MAYSIFRKWTNQRIIEKIFEIFVAKLEKCNEVQIDSTYIKAHQQSAEAKKTSDECIGHIEA